MTVINENAPGQCLRQTKYRKYVECLLFISNRGAHTYVCLYYKKSKVMCIFLKITYRDTVGGNRDMNGS